MFPRAGDLKKIPDVFWAAWNPRPFQISCSWEQATVLLTSNPTGQRLESVTDHKFMAKQTFRAWGKMENNWQKNYSGKKQTVEDLPSVLFSIQVLLGSEQAFVPWKFTTSLKKNPLLLWKYHPFTMNPSWRWRTLARLTVNFFGGFLMMCQTRAAGAGRIPHPPKTTPGVITCMWGT